MAAAFGARWVRALLLTFCLALPSLGLAQATDKFDAAEARVEALANAGKLAPALALSRKLVAAARKALKKDPKLAVFLGELAVLEARQGHLAEAERFQREANVINSEVAGTGSRVMIGGLTALADILAKGTGSKLAEAETTLAQALAIAEDAYGPGSPETADVQRRLAALMDLQGRKPEAEQLRTRLADAERQRTKEATAASGQPQSPTLASIRDRIAETEVRVRANPGETSPQRDLADLYAKLGDLQVSQGASAEAQNSYRRSLEILNDLAKSNPNLADLPASQANLSAKIDAAKQAASRAAAGADKAGAGQPNTAEPPPAAEMPGAPSTAPSQATIEATPPTAPKTELKPQISKRTAPVAPAAPAPGGQITEITVAPEAAPEYHVVDVFFGTNRKPYENTARVSFTANEAAGLTLGMAQITVPVSHQVPSVERPWTLRIPGTAVELTLGREDPNRHFTIQSIEALPEDKFLARIKDQLGQSQTYKGQALVFVHGFYNTFDDALYRTAQMTYDMQFDGAAFMFSWPSAGTLDAYRTDRGKAERAGTQLRAFLDLVARKSGAKRITVIAHSMGNLPLMEALDETVAGAQASPDAVIDDVVLAAPDIGRKEFAALAEHMNHIRGGVTLYAASNDLALAASRRVNGEGRAGDTQPDGPLLLPHVDTIDATSTSMQIFRLNHFYVAESSAVLCDLERLLRTGLHPPDVRTQLLRPVADGQGKYYAFR